ncbi:MAG: hypothetical protein JZU65_13990 [Chlorobium sp.]|nr:hypothetical protein [Chlorobium sp.]
MKKVILVILAIGFTATLAYAGRWGSGGVKKVTDAGNGRYHVFCNSGDKVIGPVGNGWGDDTKNSFGDSFSGLSLQQAAELGCR